jgi:predicted dehydrogenase
VRALEGGKAVFLEKPLSVGEAELSRIEPLLGQGARLVVDFNRSLSPAAHRMAAHFGARSEPLSINYRVNAGFLEPPHWLRDPAVGGGRVVGEGCHFVDFCSAVIGRPLESVQAVSLGAGPTTLHGDNFILLLRYDDGSVASVTYVAAGDRAMPKERIEALGVGRSVVIDDFRKVELFLQGRRRRTRPFQVRDKGHAATLGAALRFFRDGGRPPIPYERLLETTKATFAARDALANSQEEAVSLGAV